ncbi:DMT family transporter [Photobacterium halotolerans]|uniref:DMT family transporter n=1 Tax=Photobacterium halotolerans TaxID=265726 RepID=UPI0003FDECB4|nr:DMT family transporter [Photobacterium halotolerans]
MLSLNQISHLKLFFFTVLISLSFPIGSYIMASMDPLVVTWVRYLLASLLFVGVLVAKRQFRIPSAKDLGRYTLISLPALGYFVAMFIALRDTSPLDASALYTTVPLMSAILAAFVFKRSTSMSVTLALLGGMLGAGLIIFRGDLSAAGSIAMTASNKIYLLGCLGMALNPIIVKKCYRGESFIHLTCWTLICATGLLTVAIAPQLVQVQWTQIPADIWLGIGYLAVFATAISFFLFQQGSVALAPEQVSAYTYLIPVLVLLVNRFTGNLVPWEEVSYGVVTVLLSMTVMIRRGSPGTNAVVAKPEQEALAK